VSVAVEGSSEADAARSPRRLLVAGAVVVAVGLALVGSAHPDAGGTVLVAGWVTLAWGIHRFGRQS
jgi:hypothetical protein